MKPKEYINVLKTKKKPSLFGEIKYMSDKQEMQKSSIIHF